VWRVPLVSKATQERIGEVVIDAYSSLILEDKSTVPEILEARILGRDEDIKKTAYTADIACWVCHVVAAELYCTG
jgi:hypothetical protein